MRFLLLGTFLLLSSSLRAGQMECKDARLGYRILLEDQGGSGFRGKKQGWEPRNQFLVGPLTRVGIGTSRELGVLACTPASDPLKFNCVNRERNHQSYSAEIYWYEVDETLAARLYRGGVFYSRLVCRWLKDNR